MAVWPPRTTGWMGPGTARTMPSSRRPALPGRDTSPFPLSDGETLPLASLVRRGWKSLKKDPVTGRLPCSPCLPFSPFSRRRRSFH